MLDWTQVLSLLGGPLVLGGLVLTGIGARWIRPLIQLEIQEHEGKATTQDKYKQLAAAVVQEAVRREDGDVAKALAALGAELGGPLTKLVEESTRTLSSLTTAVTDANERSEKRHAATAELLRGKVEALEVLVNEQRQTSQRVDALVQVLEYRALAEEDSRPRRASGSRAGTRRSIPPSPLPRRK